MIRQYNINLIKISQELTYKRRDSENYFLLSIKSFYNGRVHCMSLHCG